MSTSWQWLPETKTAVCNYCGFATTYTGDFPGHIEHDCDPALHPPIITSQGLHLGRSPRPEALSRIPLDQLLACIHRGPEVRQERCPTCPYGTRIKIFACAIHGECQLDGKMESAKFCGQCAEFAASPTPPVSPSRESMH
jgi:hypothetical protein